MSFPFAQGKTDYYKCHIAAFYSSKNIPIRLKAETFSFQMNFISEKPVHFIEQLLKSKNLKKISRCLLVSSFIEDGLRMLFANG